MQLPSPVRLLAVLTRPKEAWPEIAREPATLRTLYTGWILWLATIPPVASAIGVTLFWQRLAFVEAYIPGFSYTGTLIRALIIGYLLQILLVSVLSWLISVLAVQFQGQADLVQATKSVAYAMTPAWIAGVFQLFAGTALPALVSLAAGLYGLYLLYLALPLTMRCPVAKSTAYLVVVALIAIVLQTIVGATIGGV